MALEEKDIPKDYLVKNIGSGATATCYITKDNRVYKKFNGVLDYTLLCIKYLSTLKSDYITFPKELVYSNGELVGYIKDYAEGKMISELNGNININNLIQSLRELEEETLTLSDYLMLTDLTSDNIVYDEKTNKMTIIDSDYFEPVINGELHRGSNDRTISAMIENQKWINQSFYGMLVKAKGITDRIDQTIDFGSIGAIMTSSEFKSIINDIEKITGNKIETINDYYDTIAEARVMINGKTRI